jgi:hypothetical protein
MSSGYMLCMSPSQAVQKVNPVIVASKDSVGIYTAVGHRTSRATGGVSVEKIAGPAVNGSVWTTTFKCSGCLANNGKSTVGAAVARRGKTAPLIWAWVSTPGWFDGKLMMVTVSVDVVFGEACDAQSVYCAGGVAQTKDEIKSSPRYFSMSTGRSIMFKI